MERYSGPTYSSSGTRGLKRVLASEWGKFRRGVEESR